MNTPRRLLLLVGLTAGLLVVLAACGQKGPLVHPTPAPATAAAR